MYQRGRIPATAGPSLHLQVIVYCEKVGWGCKLTFKIKGGGGKVNFHVTGYEKKRGTKVKHTKLDR